MTTSTIAKSSRGATRFAGFALTLTLAAAAMAADNDLSSKDKTFVTKAAEAGHAEVTAGNVAISNSRRPDVQNFAKQMVADHTKAADELQQIAVSKGITPPAEPDSSQKKMIEKLQKAKSEDFDKLYAKEAGVQAHKDAVALFTDEAKNGKDAQLKSYAQQTLPTLQHHYSMARSLDKSLK